ncbi:MAG: hypothetical protein ACRC18_07030 [Cetobacterium sp.]
MYKQLEFTIPEEVTEELYISSTCYKCINKCKVYSVCKDTIVYCKKYKLSK